MSEEVGLNKKTSLVQAIARGEAIAAWAKKNEVARRTAFRWASEPEVRREAEATRRRALGRAIGRLSSAALKAADRMITLTKEAESESLQLRAWRDVLGEQDRQDGPLVGMSESQHNLIRDFLVGLPGFVSCKHIVAQKSQGYWIALSQSHLKS